MEVRPGRRIANLESSSREIPEGRLYKARHDVSSLRLRPACHETLRGLRIRDPPALQIDSIEIFQKSLTRLAYLECSDRDARHTTLSLASRRSRSNPSTASSTRRALGARS